MKISDKQQINKVLPFADGRIIRLERKTHIMGILNVTPDSFSDGGDYLNIQDSVRYAKQLESLGCDIIDIGGYSTRPNAKHISEEDETRRVVDAVLEIRKAKVKTFISVDTFRASVAKIAIENGTDIINDVSGGLRDENMYKIVKEHNVPYILMHSRGDQNTMMNLTYYGDNLISSIVNELNERLNKLIHIYKVFRWNIVVDPGIGFAKDTTQNIEIIKQLASLKSQIGNYPILLGPSRKKFLYDIVKKETPKERDYATNAVVAISSKTCEFVRIHNVAQTLDVLSVSDVLNLKAELKDL